MDEGTGSLSLEESLIVVLICCSSSCSSGSMLLGLRSPIMKGDVLDAVEHDVMMHKCCVHFILVGIIIVANVWICFLFLLSGIPVHVLRSLLHYDHPSGEVRLLEE
jgi:hypothetical protein